MGKNNQGGALWYYPIKDAQGNFVKNPDAGDIPTFIDVYKEVRGTPSGWEWEAFSSWFDDSAGGITEAPIESKPADGGRRRTGRGRGVENDHCTYALEGYQRAHL